MLTKLPNADKAIVESTKLYGYILSFSHPVGRFKAAFFQRLRYTSKDWEAFEQSLRKSILSHDVIQVIESPYGCKYIVEGSLAGSFNETVQVVTVWGILKGESIPRFITVYPGGTR